MTHDPISDLLSRIRNAQAARHARLEVPSSRLKRVIADVLKREGYLADVDERAEGFKKMLTITLKYGENGTPAIQSLRRVSTPGRRVYRGASALPRVLSDLGIAIVSTPAGVMTNKEARRRKLGGEVLCEIT